EERAGGGGARADIDDTRKVRNQSGLGPARLRPIAELAVAVPSPTSDGAIGETDASVFTTHRDTSRIGGHDARRRVHSRTDLSRGTGRALPVCHGRALATHEAARHAERPGHTGCDRIAVMVPGAARLSARTRLFRLGASGALGSRLARQTHGWRCI